MSKKGQREVSPFVGHELLYDYLTGHLDEERRRAVEEHVKYSRDAQLDLNKIQSGQSYAERLSQTVVSEPVIERINSPATYFTVLMQKSNFEKWPVGLKWGLEALVVVSVIVVLLTVAPWEKLMKIGVSPASKEVILAEVTRDKTDNEARKKDEQATPKFTDEGAPQESPAPTPAKASSAVAVAPKPAAKPSPSPAKDNPKITAKEPETTEGETTKHQGGFLYRGTISLTNIQMVGPKITEKITELGGRKAGDVELGWKRTPNSLYYHFTIPEAKYGELTSFLEQYGKVKISKEKHPRVMPDGIIRLIITVDEAKQ